MKFNCGITWEEKLKRMKAWHKWFAWHPITIKINDQGEKTCVWLVTVERSSTYWADGADSGWDHEYREITK